MRARVLLVPVLLAACDASDDATPTPPDPATVLLTDVVVWGDDAPTRLAIRGDRIIARGEAADAHVDDATEVFSLEGRTALPGLTDTHTHLLAGSFVFDKLVMVGTSGMDAILGRVDRYATENPDVEWIVGYGWIATTTEDPSGIALDAVVSDRPVVLFDSSGHAVLVNSEAMRRAGIDASTESPPGGAIDLDPHSGEPVGVLREAAIQLVSPVVLDAFGDAALGENLVASAETFVDGGITSVSEILAVPGVDLGRPQVLAAAEAAGTLPVRVAYHMPAFTLDDLAQVEAVRDVYDGDLVRFAGVKVWVDGTTGSGEAWSKEPSVGDPEDHGMHYFDAEELAAFVRAAEEGGWHLKAHVNGDAAVEALLDALEQVREERGELKQRYSLEHAVLVAPPDYGRMAELGVVASIQPGLALLGPLSTQLDLWADERAERTWDFRGLREAGVRLAIGSDWPVLPAPPDALHTLSTAVDADGRRALTLDEAVDGLTRHAAYTLGREDELGCLEVGCLADLVVLSADPRGVSADAIRDLDIEQVWLGGRQVR